MIDFQTIKERLDLLTEVEKDLGPGHKSGRWVLFSCPFPGHKHGDSKPSLSVTPDNGRFFCFSCGRKGDVITWLQEYRGLTWREIGDLAGSDPGSVASRPRPAPPPPQADIPPAAIWQARALAFVEDCERRLWQPEGAQALAWLQELRGLKPETIRRYRLGYCPELPRESRAAWGLPEDPDSKGVWLPKGVVIPWLVGGALWGVNMRRPAGDPKYYKLPGSKAALFGADNLRGAEIVLLTEGELDCILAAQELGDVAGVATLGSASKRLDLATWGVYLLPARAILAAYDLDPAGSAGLAALAGRSARVHSILVPALRAGDKDITDYHQAGGNLWEWLKYNLDRLDALRSRTGRA